jgi:coenzyme PQQ precursor peptide PqqA
MVPLTWESLMAWKTPKNAEVQIGMEINMYACATRMDSRAPAGANKIDQKSTVAV